jgi:hypothetical protein
MTQNIEILCKEKHSLINGKCTDTNQRNKSAHSHIREITSKNVVSTLALFHRLIKI